jgi:ABC-2 type transport system ATP-binding protein
MGIIGQNGAGKSTTLKMIAGLLTPSYGSVTVLGHDMARGSQAQLVKQRIGYLPEESALYATMTVRDYLLFFAEVYRVPRKVAEARIEEQLTALRLPERDKMTSELSKGMRRKVAIARALLHDPELLIFDEPNSGLDPVTSLFIIDYLRQLAQRGKTIILSAHNLFHIEYICDRVAIIKDGQLVVCDTVDALRSGLGRRAYEVTFRAVEGLPYEVAHGNYRFQTDDIAEVAALLTRISHNDWSLVNLSVHETALEEIYVHLVNGSG